MYSEPTQDNTFDKYTEMRLHMEQLLSASIIDLDIPMKIAIPLDGIGVRRLKDLVRLSRGDLLKVNRIGQKSVDDIERILARFDLYLGMEV